MQLTYQLCLCDTRPVPARNYCSLIRRKKLFAVEFNFDHDALQNYSNMLKTGFTVRICPLYSNNAVKTTDFCYSVSWTSVDLQKWVLARCLDI